MSKRRKCGNVFMTKKKCLADRAKMRKKKKEKETTKWSLLFSVSKTVLSMCIYHLQVINASIHPSKHLFPLLWGFWTWVQCRSESRNTLISKQKKSIGQRHFINSRNANSPTPHRFSSLDSSAGLLGKIWWRQICGLDHPVETSPS